uniref:Uncharacterized protein n=1 Tax=Avena sativa TaxID=4498 RepID=A0ACD5UVV7_AVESA
MVQMKNLSRWIPRLSASVHRLFSTARPLLAAPAPVTPRWRPSALAQQTPTGFPASSTPTRRVPRLRRPYRHMTSSSRVQGVDLRKPPSAKDFIISLGKTQGVKNVEDADSSKVITRYSYVPPANSVEDETAASGDAIFADQYASRTTLEVTDSKPDTSGDIVEGITGCELSSVDKDSWAAAEVPDYVRPMEIFPNSSHRDGSIYSGTDDWKSQYRIADRNETCLEAMMFSDPTDCRIRNGTCVSHSSRHMLQFLSLRLAKVPAELGSVELYGYIAARDNLNPLLNYIVNFTRDDPIIVEQGPISLSYTVCVSRLNFAYEATIEVVISQVQSSFSMRLGCFTSGLHEEIPLFDGAIGESCGLKRSVVAVASDDQMELKLKIATDSCIPAEYYCCFEAKQHGRSTQEIITSFALIAVKVTWSTLIEDEE